LDRKCFIFRRRVSATVLNQLDRSHLVMVTIDRLRQTGDKRGDLKQ
jgi:hypothetical protein